MNTLNRRIENIVSTDLKYIDSNHVAGKRAFQVVKLVTGRNHNQHTDYNVEDSNDYYGFQTITISGKKGFIRVTLEPLFKVA